MEANTLITTSMKQTPSLHEAVPQTVPDTVQDYKL